MVLGLVSDSLDLPFPRPHPSVGDYMGMCPVLDMIPEMLIREKMKRVTLL